jgi:hypothetical protein
MLVLPNIVHHDCVSTFASFTGAAMAAIVTAPPKACRKVRRFMQNTSQ